MLSWDHDDCLVVGVHAPVGTSQRAELARALDTLIAERRPSGLVVALARAAGTNAVVSVVLRIFRHCVEQRMPMAAACPLAATRHLMRVNQPALPVFAAVEDAVAAVGILQRR
ncbi:hypothetical protein LG634_19490 [Streptomyces bambusae]|uniref:hypothetical protein n=1 Tax=Streptomyces bambusae TaxID=1550616 RepID=UPI001CFDC150|nr:hypothetical protein [Streptomyces bambusae]MCB5167013.1 hypothetical protein [Streptomyces bambusae]